MNERDQNMLNFLYKKFINALDSIPECDSDYYYEQGQNKDGTEWYSVFCLSTDKYILQINMKEVE